MSLRPRIVAPVYGSSDHVRMVSSTTTAAGQPVAFVTDPSGHSSSLVAGYLNDQDATTPLSDPIRTPSPLLDDPALMSDRNLLEDYSFEDQIERLEMEVEMRREEQRIVSGIDTKDFYAMLRSFDKQVQHVRLCPPPHDGHIPSGLDLHPDPNEELSVIKARNSLERLYTSIGMGLLRVGRELQRIGSWEDGVRSSIALALYSYAWWCEMIIPSILIFTSILVLIPSSRRFFFERAAHRVTKETDGKAVHQLVEERAENPWGPAAVEASATHWAEGVQDVVTSLSAGHTTKEEKSARKAVKAKFDEKLDHDKEKLHEADQGDEKDDERNRKELALRMYAQPAMRVVAGLADKWERMEHVLQPKGHLHHHRRYAVFLQLLLPLLLASIFVSERMMSRALGLICGLALFSQPILSHVIHELDTTIPDWKSRMILEFNIFETSPTNAQLVLSILRDAERRKSPLGPAPHPDDENHGIEQEDVSDNEEDAGDVNSVNTASENAKDNREKMVTKMGQVSKKGKQTTKVKARRAWDRIGRAKEEGFALVAGHRQMDIQTKAEHLLDKLHISKDHRLVSAALDHMPSRPTVRSGETPSSFYVWHKKHGPGHIVIHPHNSSKGLPPRIEISTVKRVKASEESVVDLDEKAFNGNLFVSIDDVVALKKVGLSAVKHAALSWALDAEGAGGTGLEITVVRHHLVSESLRNTLDGTPMDDSWEQTIVLKSIVRRDELFNRLVAIGGQRWQML